MAKAQQSTPSKFLTTHVAQWRQENKHIQRKGGSTKTSCSITRFKNKTQAAGVAVRDTHWSLWWKVRPSRGQKGNTEPWWFPCVFKGPVGWLCVGQFAPKWISCRGNDLQCGYHRTHPSRFHQWICGAVSLHRPLSPALCCVPVLNWSKRTACRQCARRSGCGSLNLSFDVGCHKLLFFFFFSSKRTLVSVVESGVVQSSKHDKCFLSFQSTPAQKECKNNCIKDCLFFFRLLHSETVLSGFFCSFCGLRNPLVRICSLRSFKGSKEFLEELFAPNIDCFPYFRVHRGPQL